MDYTNFVELRQYTLFDGQRDRLIELFEREFVETQEASDIQVFGRFVDLDDPNRFVWMRGFSDYKTRGRALTDFYGGPVWAANREVANATMIDSDNVLLLQPLEDPGRAREDLTVRKGLLRVTIHYMNDIPVEIFTKFWHNILQPTLADVGYLPFCPLMTTSAENNFPPLPLRDDPVFLWFMTFRDEKEEREFSRWWRSRTGWRNHLTPEIMPAFMRKPEILRLSPVGNEV